MKKNSPRKKIIIAIIVLLALLITFLVIGTANDAEGSKDAFIEGVENAPFKR